ncbi:hypothetical protein HDU99_000744 [Rhizoclosmatium hyalinum]|nr:hypothetical protein HDU99_000744 [Rhizoclosmatium hyalinum]
MDFDFDDGFDEAEMARALDESMRSASSTTTTTIEKAGTSSTAFNNYSNSNFNSSSSNAFVASNVRSNNGNSNAYSTSSTSSTLHTTPTTTTAKPSPLQQSQPPPNQLRPAPRQPTLFEAFKIAPPQPTTPNAALPLAAAREAAKLKLQKNQQQLLMQQLPQPPNALQKIQLQQKLNQSNAMLDDPSVNLAALVSHHHRMNRENLKSWLYPTNCPVREYQFNVIQASMFQNTLVALPTGLGKTFIAAVVMFNFYRWFPEGKIVFMAPTKPLVAQQIEACYKITGIPQQDTDEMTGAAKVEDRRRSWAAKRVFFLTPQVMQNDLSRGTCPADKVVLVVVDEAHRASGKHAYCEVVRILTDEKSTFRVLALTATPGADVKTVQNVIDNLQISKIEIRTEDSLDIKPYTHERNLELIVLKPSPEIVVVSELFKKVLEPHMKRLVDFKAFYCRDPTEASRFGLIQARMKFQKDNPQRNFIVEADFGICISLCELHTHLVQLGLRMFLRQIEAYTAETLNPSSTSISKSRKSLVLSPAFQKMITTARAYQDNPDFLSHPKLGKLVEAVVSHFEKHAEAVKEGTKDWQTRVMVFSNFRESVEEIKEALSKHEPLVKVMSFVGQSGGKKGGVKGCTQKEQLELIEKFGKGGYNVLVATCIGEEGLDIGDVDLIVCYDAQTSPVRMLQRMGRTGRKREGKVILLLSEGREEDAHRQSQMKYKSIQKAIIEGQGNKLKMFPVTKENTLFPPGIVPECVKADLEIPDYDIKKKSVGGKVVSAAVEKKQQQQLQLKQQQPARHKFEFGAGAYLTEDQLRDYERDLKSNRPLSARKSKVSLSSATVWQSMELPTWEVPNGILSRRFVKIMQLTETLATQESTANGGVAEDVHNELMESCLLDSDRRAIDERPLSEWKPNIKLDSIVDTSDELGVNQTEDEASQGVKRKRPKLKFHRLSNYDQLFQNDEDGEDLVDASEIVMGGLKKKKVDGVEDDEMEAFFHNTPPPLPAPKVTESEFAFVGDDDWNNYEDPGVDVNAEVSKGLEVSEEPPVVNVSRNDAVCSSPTTPRQSFPNSTPPQQAAVPDSNTQKSPVSAANDMIYVPDTPVGVRSNSFQLPPTSPPSSFPILVVPDSPLAEDGGPVGCLQAWDDESDGFTSLSQAPTHPAASGRFWMPDSSWPQDKLCLSKGPRLRPVEFYEWPVSWIDGADANSMQASGATQASQRGGSSIHGDIDVDFDQLEAKLFENSNDEFDDMDMDDGMFMQNMDLIDGAIAGAFAAPAAEAVKESEKDVKEVMGPPAPPGPSGYKKKLSQGSIYKDAVMKTMSDYSSPIISRKFNPAPAPAPVVTFSSPMESQMPFARRPQQNRRIVQDFDEDEDDEEQDKEEGKAGKLRRKRSLERDPRLSEMFEQEEEEVWEDEFDESTGGGGVELSSDVGNPTPMAIKMVRQRLIKKPRRAPRPRNFEPAIFPTVPVERQKTGPSRPRPKNVQIGDVEQFFDREAALSEEEDDSGDDENGDEDLDADLEGFINDDSFGISSSQSLPTESPGISMYHRSILSPHGGISRENRAYDAMLEKYRNMEKQRKHRPREEWEGLATQADAGANAQEFYDDPELADFVVDDDFVEYFSSPVAKPAKRRRPANKPAVASSLANEIVAPAPPVEAPTPAPTKKVLAPTTQNEFTPITRIVANIPSSDFKSSFDVDGPSPIIRNNVENLSKEEKELLFVGNDHAHRHVEQVVTAPKDERICILVDNREIRSGITSILKGKFGCRVEFRQLAGGDYILSNQVAIERKSKSDLLSSTFSKRIYDQLDLLKRMYSSPYLLVELESSESESVTTRNQFEGIVAGLLRNNVRIIFSQSRDDSARILFELAKSEKQQGMTINVPAELPSKDSGIVSFLMSIPGVSDATCLEIIQYGKFLNLAEFLSCGADELLRRLPKSLGAARAKQIVEYLHRDFDSNAAIGINL